MRHTTHHGLSFVLSIFLSTIISEILRGYLPFLASLNTTFAGALKKNFRLQIEPGKLELIIIAFGVVLIYGYIREFAERRKS